MKRIIRWFCLVTLLLSPACGLLVEEGREVVAEVGSDRVRLKDLLSRIRELPFEQRARTNDANELARIQARQFVLRTIVNERLLLKESKARGITVSEEEIDAVFHNEHAMQDPTGGVHVEGMKDASSGHEHDHGGMEPTRGEIREMREKIMMEKLLETQLSDMALRKYYDENIDRFMTPVPLYACELVVVDPANGALIDTIHQKATEEKVTLANALGSLKDPPPLIFAGRIPPSPLSQMAPPMKEAVEKLRDGDVSEPFHLNPGGQDQYAVARVVNYIDRRPFENVKERLRNRLYQEFLDELEEKYKVVYYEEVLNYRLGD